MRLIGLVAVLFAIVFATTRVAADVVPDDPMFPQQWGLTKIRAPAAWSVTTGSDAVIVAVLDSGVDATHPDLMHQLVPGIDLVYGDPYPEDKRAHGTAVTGVIGAETNNSVYVAGLVPTVKVMPVQACDDSGHCPVAALAQGVIYATDHGAKIINISQDCQDFIAGDPCYYQPLQDAINYAYSRGVLVVAAAGNGGQIGNPVEHPAAMDHVTAVGATTETDALAGFSSYGPYVDLTAPGVNICTTAPVTPPFASIGLICFSGTSASAPLVAGTAALMLAVNPSLSPDQIEQILASTAFDLGTPGRDDLFGWGRIDALDAVEAARDLIAPTPTLSPSPSRTPPPTVSPTRTQTLTATRTPTPTQTRTPTLTKTPTPTLSPTPCSGSGQRHQHRRCRNR